MHYLLKIKKAWFVFFLVFPLSIALQAQEESFVQVDGDLKFDISPGEEKHVTLSFIIKEGFHIQANQVTNENLIPSELSINPPNKFVFGEAVFPESKKFIMKGAAEALLVYSDTLKIYLPVKAMESAEKGNIPMKGKLHYQPCDSSKCYFPRDLIFDLVANIHK